jgi:uncharacterized coiled-coil protein SlyX
MELASAAAEVATVTEQFGNHPTNPDRLVLEAAELRLAWACESYTELEQNLHRIKLENIWESIEDEKREIEKLRALLLSQLEELKDMESQALDESITEPDSPPLTLLKEVFDLQDQGQFDRAKAKEGEAARLWRKERARRSGPPVWR